MKGPPRRYAPEVEAEQRDVARGMLGEGGTWSEVLRVFAGRGWLMSLTTFRKRLHEWGIAGKEDDVAKITGGLFGGDDVPPETQQGHREPTPVQSVVSRCFEIVGAECEDWPKQLKAAKLLMAKHSEDDIVEAFRLYFKGNPYASSDLMVFRSKAPKFFAMLQRGTNTEPSTTPSRARSAYSPNMQTNEQRKEAQDALSRYLERRATPKARG